MSAPENDALVRIKDVEMPDAYRRYYGDLAAGTYDIFSAAAKAKSTLVDSSGIVEPKVAFDLADRVAKMHDIDIAGPLRELLEKNGKEITALTLSGEIARGKYLPADSALEERLDLAVRVGLAIVTEGVTIAPLQGISKIAIRENKNGSKYLSVSIAGPMRSAGGTESAVTMLIADHVRKIAGLAEYEANSFDDETGRFVEELRIYEREASNFQFHVLDEDIITVISNLPVELDGVDTDPFEVVNHKGMTRIKTDRVRGGALRVLNDGLIGRSKKLLQRINLYKLDGWEWLGQLKGAVQTGEDKEGAAAKRMREVITGRSVLSSPGRRGGFRLRYGRACNTGFASVGVHPALAEILDHTIAVGTQIKIDIPSKGATIAFVDSIETPTVLLKNGDVIRIRDAAHGLEIKGSIARILYMGDILISFGDFLENNAKLVSSGYVEEFWAAELKEKLAGKPDAQIDEFTSKTPTASEALALSREKRLSLHPRYLYYWDQIDHAELESLLNPELNKGTVKYPESAKVILEKLGVPHKLQDGHILLEGDEAVIVPALLAGLEPDASVPVLDLISRSGVQVRPKSSTWVGVRIGRPEKAAPRNMKPPTHCLFPVSKKGGPMRDILRASHSEFYISIANRTCASCGEQAIGVRCQACGEKTILVQTCPLCQAKIDGPKCPKCKRRAISHTYRAFPLKHKLETAQESTALRAQSPLKGVENLIGQDRIAEPLEKGLIRQSRNLTVFKDGTIRFDATNSPLTHFKPVWIGTSAARLRKLGYTKDADGADLRDENQTVELKMQDVIIPHESAKYLVNVCKYVDAELARFYGKPKFYNVADTDELIGHLVIGLAPHTSVGIVARIIGYTNTHVCFGTPNWHSAKRRDADGDADSIMLLMDALLNFSRHFLSDKIGGLMDAPLLVQPLVLPHESQPQAHNLEVMRSLPLEFYAETLSEQKASAVKCVETARSRAVAAQFTDYHFTHHTSSMTTSKPRSAYSTLSSMLDKLDLQIRNADLIDAVDTSETISHVISTHLIPDIIGNLRSYARQSVRCTRCGRKYRRPPLIGRCICKHDLIQTITRPSVEKYLNLAVRLATKYNVGEYQRGRIHVLGDEVDMVFGKGTGDQALLTDYN